MGTTQYVGRAEDRRGGSNGKEFRYSGMDRKRKGLKACGEYREKPRKGGAWVDKHTRPAEGVCGRVGGLFFCLI